MISKITDSISRVFGTADGEVAYHKYKEMTQTAGFEIHKKMLVEIANGLLQYMVTKKFTDLDSKQKDIEQRAIYECKELIEFLLDPIKGLQRHKKIVAHNIKMQRTAMGAGSKKRE